MENLTLSQALKEGRLDDFAEQAEAEGIGPAHRAQFDVLMGTLTTPPPEDQTSRSPDCGGSREK